jgi:hypothetical protein
MFARNIIKCNKYIVSIHILWYRFVVRVIPALRRWHMLDLLTEEDVSKQLHVSLASLRRWRLEGRGPRFIKVSSLVRYRPEDLEEWLVALPTGGSAMRREAAVSAELDRYRKSVKA